VLNVRLDDSKIIKSEEVLPGVVLDLNEHNQVIGIEMLHPFPPLASTQFPREAIPDRMIMEPAPEPLPS
jgi:uncharacterized protein YuzE